MTMAQWNWDVCLKIAYEKWGIELECITDQDMYMFFEQAKRDGMSKAIHRHAGANHPYLYDCNPDMKIPVGNAGMYWTLLYHWSAMAEYLSMVIYALLCLRCEQPLTRVTHCTNPCIRMHAAAVRGFLLPWCHHGVQVDNVIPYGLHTFPFSPFRSLQDDDDMLPLAA